ncbi:MAG: hypothetical protein HC896_06650 [Bacteroidales bacterium]|nr:hypothetical protein [Bacteroidales bacterium]
MPIKSNDVIYGILIIEFFGQKAKWPDFEIFYFETLANIIANANKKKEFEDVLKENEIKLKALNSTKDKFFSIIAHDLKNPFNTILGFSELLRASDLENKEKVKKYIEAIFNTSKTAYSLLENLLEWSRAQTGRLKIKPVSFSVGEVIERNIELLVTTAQRKKYR